MFFFKLSASGLLSTEVNQPNVFIQSTNEVVQLNVVMQSTVEIQPDSVTNPPISVVIQPTVVVRPTAVAHEEFNHSVQSTGVPVEHDGNESLLHNDIMELQLYQNALGVFVCKENSLNFLYCPGKEYNQYIRKGFW